MQAHPPFLSPVMLTVNRHPIASSYPLLVQTSNAIDPLSMVEYAPEAVEYPDDILSWATSLPDHLVDADIFAGSLVRLSERPSA
jgi:hypothetical protein